MSGLIGNRFVQLCIDDSANRLPNACRMIVEGPLIDNTGLTEEQIAALAPVNKLTPVRSDEQLATLFGDGSVLSQGLAVALACCRSQTLEIYALPRADTGNTAAEYESTIVVNAAGSGNGVINIYWGEGRYTQLIRVFDGMTAAQIATAIADIAPSDLFFTVNADGDKVKFKAKNGGDYGNTLYLDYNWIGNPETFPEGVTITTVQTVQGAGTWARFTDYESILGNACCACCLVHLSNSPAWQSGALEYVESTWGCDKPGCQTMGYAYAQGTVEQVLPYGGNWTHSALLAHCVGTPGSVSDGDRSSPWMKTAAYGAKSCCLADVNPELSIEGFNFGVLDCIEEPASCSTCYDYADKQELNDEGFVTTAQSSTGAGFMTSPYIETDTSNGLRDEKGRKSRTWEDMNSSRLARKTALAAYQEVLQYQGVSLFTNATAVREGVKGTSARIIRGKMRAWFKQNIGILFSEPYNLDEQIIVQQESDALPECYGDPRRLIISLKYEPPLRIKDMRITMRPEFNPECSTN